MSRIIHSVIIACLGLTALAPTTARAGSCAIDCFGYGSCAIDVKGAVKCKCTPFPVCKRIWAIEATTLDDFTAAADEQLDELFEMAVELEHDDLALALEDLREAADRGDAEAYTQALAAYERQVQALPSDRTEPVRRGR